MRPRRQPLQEGHEGGARRRRPGEVRARVQALKSREPVVVFAAGCFNRVHPAHLRLLRRAKVLGDRLVVVLSHDAHNKKPNAVPSSTRKRWLEALGVADRVVVGDPDGFVATLRRERPDILVLGYDQKLPDADTEAAVRAMGVEVVRFPWFPGKEDASASHCA